MCLSRAAYDRFGVATIGVEVRTPTEEQKSMIQTYASFMHSFLGRGVCESPSHLSGHYPEPQMHSVYLLVGILMLKSVHSS